MMDTSQELVADFNRHYYEARGQLRLGGEGVVTWTAPTAYWLGLYCIKNPCDLWVYQEILYECRPDLIVEAGTAAGGSALFLAGVCDLLGHGKVLTIDTVLHPSCVPHPRIEYYTGDILAAETVQKVVRAHQDCGQNTMFIFDDDHGGAHVEEEMERYAPLVTVGQYMIVEDTNINGHPVVSHIGDGPWEAVQRFLPRHPEFQVDRTREKFMLTFNPGGYLRRVR